MVQYILVANICMCIYIYICTFKINVRPTSLIQGSRTTLNMIGGIRKHLFKYILIGVVSFFAILSLVK